MILKAGTYRLNEILTSGGYSVSSMNEYLSFASNQSNFIFFELTLNGSTTPCGICPIIANIDDEYNGFVVIADIEGSPSLMYINGIWEGSPADNEWINVDWFEGEFTLATDTDVTDTFGTWYIENTNYNEINPPEKSLVTIEYNGATIAQLNAGETAILKCEGLPMETDITVKVNG